jgi:hypothetical protein
MAWRGDAYANRGQVERTSAMGMAPVADERVKRRSQCCDRMRAGRSSGLSFRIIRRRTGTCSGTFPTERRSFMPCIRSGTCC